MCVLSQVVKLYLGERVDELAVLATDLGVKICEQSQHVCVHLNQRFL